MFQLNFSFLEPPVFYFLLFYELIFRIIEMDFHELTKPGTGEMFIEPMSDTNINPVGVACAFKPSHNTPMGLY